MCVHGNWIIKIKLLYVKINLKPIKWNSKTECVLFRHTHILLGPEEERFISSQ